MFPIPCVTNSGANKPKNPAHVMLAMGTVRREGPSAVRFTADWIKLQRRVVKPTWGGAGQTAGLRGTGQDHPLPTSK